MLTRLFTTRVSNPPSNSADVSGFRSALPSELVRRPGVSVPPVACSVVGWFSDAVWNVTSAAVGPGCTPDAPYAARTRNWLSQEKCGKNDSSEASHDALSFG